jgi:hypothetical protein
MTKNCGQCDKHSSLISRSVIDANDIVSRFEQRHDIQRNDTQHNDTQHNNTQHNNKLNMTFRIISEYCYTECHK